MHMLQEIELNILEWSVDLPIQKYTFFICGILHDL